MSGIIRPLFTVCPGTTLYDNPAHRPFICSNEEGQKLSIKRLSNLPLKGNTIVGVSCFAVLNIAAHRPIPEEELSIVIIDRGVRVLDFWSKVSQLISETEDKETFQEELIDLYYNHQPVWGEGLRKQSTYGESINELGKEIRAGFSWVCRDDLFGKIQRIVRDGRLTVYGGDITRCDDMLFLSSELHRLGKKVDLLYTSNCHEYIKTTSSALDSYADCIDVICRDQNSYLLTTRPRTSEREILEQEVIEHASPEDLKIFWQRGRTASNEEESCFYFPKIVLRVD